jgi:hypothetical protein
MSQQNQNQEEGQQNHQQQQLPTLPMKKPTAEWSLDLTSICGNGQNALKKVPKREVIQFIFDNLNLKRFLYF